MRLYTTLVLCLATLTACSKADLLNITIPRDGYRVERDITYGTHGRQKMDIYVPNQAKHAPVIVFFYGGSWQKGSKDDYLFLGQAFASKGFITVVADYRLYPEVKYPAFIEDGARAFHYTHQRIAQYGGDPQKIFIAGHSAGAYIAMMLGADPRYLADVGANRSDVQGIIGISGPYNFLPFTDTDIKAIFSTAPDADTQPINRAIAPVPPVLLATGLDDDTVDPRNSHSMAAKLRSLGNPVVVHDYHSSDHIDIMLSLARGFRDQTPLLEDIAAFVQEYTTKGGS